MLASSMVVYGEGAYECRRHGPVRPGPRDPVAIAGGHFEPQCPRCGEELAPAAIAEDARLDPRSVYAATKLHQEHLCGAYGRAHGRAVTALRYHNVYGPDMPRDTPYAGVASIFRSELEAGRPPRVLEDGQQLRDFVHVTDVARANVLALEASDPYDGALNVASGAPRTVLDLACALSSAISTPDGRPPVVAGGSRPGDVRHVFSATAQARTAIGFTAEVPFDTGIADFARAPIRAPVPVASYQG